MEFIKDMETGEIMVRSEVVLGGFLAIGHVGDHQIKSNIETPEEAQGLLERGQAKLVKVDEAKCAVCIDGRCVYCSAADIESIGYLLPAKPVEQPVRPHVPGGTMHFATIMAIAGDAAIIQGSNTFNEAKERVTAHLDSLGYRDAIHTSVNAYKNPEGTECGAIDRVIPATTDAVGEDFEHTHTGEVKPIAATLALMYGYENPREFAAEDKLYRSIVSSLEAKLKTPYFENYSPVENRDRLMQTAPQNVELLVSDPNHPTHLHEEQGIMINEIESMTVDRDNNNGELFIYDRWFADNLARDLAGTPLEHHRLLMAGDFVTLAIANKLVAPGMPVGFLKKQESVYANV